ncbi:hypothetical protein RCH09_002569 [Actimicrobium sp. GrIS 1.19]|uniref:BON domain-containing protein n=1 Tax=Actimicrobium sp. GrIS 1.19 TaxID=3071708 RepID=UPI002E0BF061|nr:hypothetical protein [Actimicrobium sp. GrIS 1.19]
MKHRMLLPMLVAIALGWPAHAGAELRNWFNDPFFMLAAALPDCPLPAGPFITEQEMRAQSHHRAEKGTSCWLAQECELPNAYAYDQAIAAALQSAVREHNPFAQSSLWVTVQGRVVIIEGCVGETVRSADLEPFARAVPHVQQVILRLRASAAAAPPYRPR